MKFERESSRKIPTSEVINLYRRFSPEGSKKIDGNTRSLAAVVYKLENGIFPKLPVYLGRPGFLSPFLDLPI